MGFCFLNSVTITSTVDTIHSKPLPFGPPFHLFKTVAHKTTTDGSAVQGSASRVLGGRDDIRSQSVSIERWVPPSAIKRDALPESSDDVKFRKVRCILNKLTPQTFDRLSDDLIRFGFDSQILLKGVILLIFEKALQEPKYVCMYSQLCKKLSKKVPNFDPPNPDQTTTFRRLLLNKCQDEYTNRARASAYFDQRTGRLTHEEEEEKLLAKRKMLGNIKFIGELGKLEMLTHSILHRCCEELVKKTKAEDLECLCQIMSTCGHLLDTDKGKFLMDQYFTRIQELSKNEKLPSRIRFMLQDVLELRGNHWLPRQTVPKESPKPIEDIRREAHDELGINDGSRAPGDEFRYLQMNERRPFRDFVNNPEARRPRSRNRPPLGIETVDCHPIFLNGPPAGLENVDRKLLEFYKVQPRIPGCQSEVLQTFVDFVSLSEDALVLDSVDHENCFGSLSGKQPMSDSTADGRSDSRRQRTFGSKKMTGMEDVFAPIPLGVSSLGTGPGVITPGEKPHGHETNGFHAGPLSSYRPSGGMRAFNNHQNNMQGLMNGTSFYPPHKNNKANNHFANQHEYTQNNHQTRNNHNNIVNNGYEKAPVAPRFRKQGQNPSPVTNGGPPSTAVNDDVSLRPPPNSMIKMFPQSMKPNHLHGPFFVDHAKPTMPKLSPPKNIISPKDALLVNAAKTTIEKMKAKKDKGPSKEEIMKRVEELLEEYKNHKEVIQAAEALNEIKTPERFFGDVLTSILHKSMDGNESERELIHNLMLHLVETSVVTQAQFLDAFRNILDLMGELEADIPRIKTYVAGFTSRAICQDILSLAEVAESTENGNHYPFLLLVLQQLSKTIEKPKLCKMFEESKIQLLTTLPKIDRTKDRMADILEERELSFLFPLLKIQAEMIKQLQNNPSADDFGTWIKENVDSAYHTSHGFISALATVVFKFITQETSQNQENEQGDKAIRDSERELLVKFKPIISTYFQDHVDLQVIAIYALQGAWFAMDCPKVMLLRWFVNLYELEMIEEEAFLKWKEDIRDDYPGKGNALFQVNQWLLWLEQADEDEEGEDEEQEA